MQVDRKELRDILAALRPGLNRKEFVQQTCHFMFFKDKIAVYNDKICITHPFESEEEFSVKGEEFFRLIDGITDDELELTIKNSKLKINSDSTSSSIILLAEDQNTVSSKIKELEENMSKWKPLPSNFTEALSLCSFAASPDLSRGVKACVCFVGDTCYASDGQRGSIYQMDAELKDIFNIPAKSAMELSKFPVTEYCLSNKWLCFKTEDDVLFSCSPIEGSFPYVQLAKFFNDLENLPVIELPQELKSIINEVLILASTDDNVSSGKVISILLEEGKLYVKAENSLGFVKKTIAVDFEEDDPVHLLINSNFLSQILDISVEMYVAEKYIFFANKNFRHLMIKMNSEKEE